MLWTLKHVQSFKSWIGLRSLIVLLSVTCFSWRVSALDGCPSSCDEVLCLTGIVNQTSCPQGTIYQEKQVVCGCCPACVKFLTVNEKCESPPQSFGNLGQQLIQSNSVIESKLCAPGLFCDGTCIADEGKCFSYEYQNIVTTRPSCDPDGSFAAVQCKGDFINGRCFCYGEDGERIFGLAWWKDAENMTCACSREVASILAKGERSDISLHCAPDGNYEELQCDDGLCWCAEPKTGLPIVVIVPDAMMKMLPCYVEELGESQYLRQCESISLSVNQIRDITGKHGSIFSSAALDKCDPDGSYAAVQVITRQSECAWKDKKPIGNYQAPLNEIQNMNCNCARDVFIYQENDLLFYMDCNGNGNYKDVQPSDDNTFCVDSDGYPTTGIGDYTSCSYWSFPE